MKQLIILIVTTVAVFGQLATPNTTLSSAIPANTNNSQWCLASGSSVIVPNTATGVNGSYLMVDREVAQVTGAGVSSNCFRVKRGQLGSSASVAHSAASTVWIGRPSANNPDGSRPFSDAFITLVPNGACVATDQYTLPVLYIGAAANGATPGTAYNCVQGQWTIIGNLLVTGFTGSTALQDLLGFGNATGFLRVGRANGTPQAPTAIQNGDFLGGVGFRGYQTSQFSASTGVVFGIAEENFTNSASGTKLVFSTTPPTTTTAVQQWEITGAGALRPVTNLADSLGGPSNQILGASFANCTSSATPAVCGASNVGAVAVPAAATTLVVNTTAVTAKSRIVLTMDASMGSDLGITCNTANIAAWVSARTASTSFTISTASGPVTNPMCIAWHIFN